MVVLPPGMHENVHPPDLPDFLRVLTDDHPAVLAHEVDRIRILVLNCHVVMTGSIGPAATAPVDVVLATIRIVDNLCRHAVYRPT